MLANEYCPVESKEEKIFINRTSVVGDKPKEDEEEKNDISSMPTEYCTIHKKPEVVAPPEQEKPVENQNTVTTTNTENTITNNNSNTVSNTIDNSISNEITNSSGNTGNMNVTNVEDNIIPDVTDKPPVLDNTEINENIINNIISP